MPATTDGPDIEWHRRHNKTADYWLACSHRFDHLAPSSTFSPMRTAVSQIRIALQRLIDCDLCSRAGGLEAHISGRSCGGEQHHDSVRRGQRLHIRC
jgi:hypothetical protein